MLTAHKSDEVVIPLAQDYAFNLVTNIYYQLGVVKRVDPQLMRVTGNVFITGGIGSNVPVTVTVERVDASHSRLRFACSAEEGIYYRDRAGQGIARILNSVSVSLASANVSDTGLQGRSSSASAARGPQDASPVAAVPEATSRHARPRPSAKSGVAESVGIAMALIGVVLSVVSLGGCWAQLCSGGSTGTWGFLFWSGAILCGIGGKLAKLDPPPF